MGRRHLLALVACVAGVCLVVAGSVMVIGRDSSGSPASVEMVEAERPAVSAGTPGLLLSGRYYYSVSGHTGAPTYPMSSNVPYLPLDAVTVEEIQGRQPIEVGNMSTTLVSPDGRFLAEGHTGPNEVRVFGLEAWKQIATIPVEPGLFLQAWSEDGTTVYASRDYCTFGPSPMGACKEWQRELWAIDVKQQQAERLTDLKFSAVSWDFAAGKAVALALRTETCCGIDPQGDPFVAVIDLASGDIEAEVRLPGLLAGQVKDRPGEYSTPLLTPQE